ncbi:hypothetical protein GOODEAATRI_028427 [Goodea atripinnis]|uniref:Uncharacterized protein n=1 Tax=Goodea atripinnis TaxID=208336 RepID=A0ABV0MLH2_9TELE
MRDVTLSRGTKLIQHLLQRFYPIFNPLLFVSMEICDPRNNITMCPMCDRACSYWKLVTACGTARASHLFDNPATVFFSIFMALWGKCASNDKSFADM